MRYRMQVGADTDVGLMRDNNEDSYLSVAAPTEDCDTHRFGRLFAVADGMGGHAAGEVASAMACDAVRSFYYSRSGGAGLSGMTPEAALDRLAAAIAAAHRSIHASARESSARRGMGTTLSALVILEGAALIGHVGDSRVYRLRDGVLAQLTVDHTEVQAMVDKGYLSREAASRHPLRHVLHHAVGVAEALAHIDTRVEKAHPGDIYLLSSDGLHDMITDSEIRNCLRESGDARAACRELIRRALRAGGRDNVTAVVVGILAGQTASYE